MAVEHPRYPRAPFRTPSASGFLYVGLTVDPPRGPFVRARAERDDAVDACARLARTLAARDDVVGARVFEAVLMPPIGGAPRFDVAMLVETDRPDSLDAVRAAADLDALDADLVMPADNPARIGDTGDPADGVFLFNHFLAPDGDAAVRVWEDLSGWYTAKAGIDNSLPLRPLEPSRFAFVNHARLPGGAAAFLLGQLLRPSFHRFVRRRLREHGMTALPVLYRPVSMARP
jgi:hypothetical protein